MIRFTGKVAVVTGASMGLGAAIAERLADEDARVVLVDIDARRGQDVIRRLNGAGHTFVRADLASVQAIDQLAEQVSELVKDVHVLVNNAGIFRPLPLECVTSENLDEQLSLNFVAPLLLTKKLLPLMKNRSASIINISSSGPFHHTPGRPVYDMTKGALGALTRSSAAELWQFDIRVNEVAPGPMVTEMFFGTGLDAAARKQELEDSPINFSIMGRMARPAEVAAAVAFLASSDASYITGTTLHVDGGCGGPG